MRSIDPFSFFVGHASIIAGLGGSTPSPDPRYCFHTNYLDIMPGRGVFHLTISRPRATFGELNVRVMALPKGRDATVAASLMIDLEGLNASDLHRGLRFMAVDGVKYAVYGFVTDTTDLRADALDIVSEELGIAAVHAKPLTGDKAVPARAAYGNAQSISAARRLLADRAPTADLPLAQPMLPNAGAMDLFAARWPLTNVAGTDPIDRWVSHMALQTLDFAGLIVEGSNGLLVDADDARLTETLRRGGCRLNLIQLDANDVDLLALVYAESNYDFAIVMAPTEWQVADRLETLCERLMDCLAKNGFLLVIIEVAGGGSAAAFRNRVQQLSLYCIGLGHDVMQLSFPQGHDWYPQVGATSRYIWIARK